MTKVKMPPILNWYANDEFTKGLREKFCADRVSPFVTMRLGDKWAKRLAGKIGSPVIITIGNDPMTARTVGKAQVVSVRVGLAEFLQSDRRVLALNIGAKTWADVYRDMGRAYKTPIHPASVITIIELQAI